MKPWSLAFPSGTVALTIAAVFSIGPVAQTSRPPAPAAGSQQPPGPRTYPAPTNLKVLPKNLTGEQVHTIMEQWEGALGAHCNTCHTPDPNNIGPNGRPLLNYADDSRPEKATARLMYTMTEEININYVGKIDSSGVAVTCGTCHRGHLGPEPFSIPRDDHDGQRPAQGSAPAGTAPPQPR